MSSYYGETFNLDGTPLEVYWTEDESPLPEGLTFTVVSEADADLPA